MKYLLDTHVLLWWLADSPDLPKKLYQIISAPQHQIFVSSASTWEIVLKKSLGKLSAPDNLEEMLMVNRFISLPIQVRHTVLLGALPAHHKDPFDRILVAQAMAEQLTLLSVDPLIYAYDIHCIKE